MSENTSGNVNESGLDSTISSNNISNNISSNNIWNHPFACWMMWLGARAAAVLPQAIGRAAGGGRASQLSQRTAARDKNYLATIIINVTTWNENTTKVDDLSHLYYLLCLLHTSELLLIKIGCNELQ